jgi:PHD-finger
VIFRLEALLANSHIALESRLSKEHILTDLTILYNELLDPEKMQSYEPETKLQAARLSARRLLNSKILVKHYDRTDYTALPKSSIKTECYIQIDGVSLDSICPPEFLTLPETTTLRVLKHEVTKIFKETYISFDKFEMEGLADFRQVRENIEVKHLLGSQGVAHFKGKCRGIYRMEQGQDGSVNCICGANDDDGERMVECGRCRVWKHTRCFQIGDDEKIPCRFVCSLCTSASRK